MMWHWNALWARRGSRLHAPPEGPGRAAGRRRRILDIGCNAGAQLASFHERGWELWGVDASETALARARERFPTGRFVQGLIEQADVPAGYFDAVRTSHVWEHLPDPVGLARWCRNVLRPGGDLLLYVPNHSSLLQRCAGRYSINSWIPFHVNEPVPEVV